MYVCMRVRSELNVCNLTHLSMQFRYATLLDFLLMFLGSVAAIGHGFALPALMFIFGDLTNTFINRAITQSVVVPLTNSIDVNCSAIVNPRFDGFSVTDIVETFTNGSLAFSCDYVINSTSTYRQLIMSCGQQSECLSNNDFTAVINLQVYAFVGIALGVFLLGSFQISLFQLACERQVQKIRLFYYRAILRQEIGWFDANPSGELGSRLTE